MTDDSDGDDPQYGFQVELDMAIHHLTAAIETMPDGRALEGAEIARDVLEQALDSAMIICDGCGGADYDGPMIDDAIWKLIATEGESNLCRACMGHRLGRPLTNLDLQPKVPLNSAVAPDLCGPCDMGDGYCMGADWQVIDISKGP